MKMFLVLLCCLRICRADSNNVTQSSTINDNIDKVNIHMKDNYNLQLKPDHSFILTGYTIQDPQFKLIKTYSVLCIDF
jgi:hypothetical protein